MDSQVVGDVRLNETCRDVHAVNELGLPILVMGMKNTVIAASPEGILVSDKEQSSYIKSFVDQLDQQVLFAEKSWGSFRVLDVQDTSLTIRVTLLPGHRLHYHSHENRDETWTVVSGEGTAVVDDAEIRCVSSIDFPQNRKNFSLFSDQEFRFSGSGHGKHW